MHMAHAKRGRKRQPPLPDGPSSPGKGCAIDEDEGWSGVTTHLQNGRTASAILMFQNADPSTMSGFSLDNYAQLLSCISSRVDAVLMLLFMSEVEKVVEFDTPHAAVYFAKFSR